MLAVTMDFSLKIYLSTLMKTKCWMLTEAGMRMLKGAEDAEEDRSDKNVDKEEAPVTEDPGVPSVEEVRLLHRKLESKKDPLRRTE